ncbi:MAG: hypothetical protein AB8B59_10905 [Maribacter sp.]
MKKNLTKTGLFGWSLLSIALVVSCEKSEETQNFETAEVISATELKISDEAELISDEISSIAEDIYAADEIRQMSKSAYLSDYLPECATVTTVVTDTTKEKTIDFGEGCELRNGNLLSGIINLSYLKDMQAETKTLSLTLENFTYNGVEVRGSATIERSRVNENGNPQSNVVSEFNGVWPDETTVSFSANRTREWIEGYGSGFWGDNVFLITGSATYINKLGSVFQKETIVPLRREWSCRFIVSGVLSITRNNATATVDFGNGSCDSTGILTTPDGESKEIQLRRFFNK